MSKGIPAALHHLHGPLRRIIQLLLRQAQNIIHQPQLRFVLAISIRIENAGIHRLCAAREDAILQFLDTILIPLRRRLALDLPILILRPQNTVQTIEHIALTNPEARQGETLILPLLDGRLLACNRQTQQRRQRAPALPPRTGIDPCLAVIEEGDFPIPDIEPEPLLPERQTPLVPEAAHHRHVRRAQPFNLGAVLQPRESVHALLAEPLVVEIEAVDIGHDVRHAGLDGRLDDFAMGVRRREDGEGDEEELMALERRDHGFPVVVVIVDVDGFDAGGRGAFTVPAGEGRDGVFAGFEQLFYNVFAEMAARLVKNQKWNRKHAVRKSVERARMGRTPTIATLSTCAIAKAR